MMLRAFPQKIHRRVPKLPVSPRPPSCGDLGRVCLRWTTETICHKEEDNYRLWCYKREEEQAPPKPPPVLVRTTGSTSEGRVLASVRLGLTLWEGLFEGHEAVWLRWCDADGKLVPTGRERAESAEQRAQGAEQRVEAADQRAALLAARLRELGIDPDG
jgi:hypothetical protein